MNNAQKKYLRDLTSGKMLRAKTNEDFNQRKPLGDVTLKGNNAPIQEVMNPDQPEKKIFITASVLEVTPTNQVPADTSEDLREVEESIVESNGDEMVVEKTPDTDPATNLESPYLERDPIHWDM